MYRIRYAMKSIQVLPELINTDESPLSIQKGAASTRQEPGGITLQPNRREIEVAYALK
jgi:hypothetical protein